MDWGTIGMAILSTLGGIAAVAKVVGGFVTKAMKYEHVAKDSMKLIDDTFNAAKPDPDGKITFTKEEVDQIIIDVNEVKAAYAELRGK
ncbi:MAG: hypothetical protein WC547_05715 [Candidatus Omnitrophota bacterium]